MPSGVPPASACPGRPGAVPSAPSRSHVNPVAHCGERLRPRVLSAATRTYVSTTLTLQPFEAAAPTTAGPRSSATGERIFFPGLNFVRAYAALGVVVWHMRQLMMLFRVPISEPFYDALSRVFPRGDDGVMLFFVLSGFLITYLLMAEQRRTGTVAVAKFYVRRVLRIWPLYFLLVLLGFAILPLVIGWEHYPYLGKDENFFGRLALYLVLMPNVAYALWPGGVPIGHLWSIGVEEQFYLLWPALMKWCRRYL